MLDYMIARIDEGVTDSTVKRTITGNILSLLPDIRKSRQKESSNSKKAEAI